MGPGEEREQEYVSESKDRDLNGGCGYKLKGEQRSACIPESDI